MELRYVNLGLPSGTLWAGENAEHDGREFFTLQQAREAFGESLPTAEQFRELVECTAIKWDARRKGLVFGAVNGNALFIPAKGEQCPAEKSPREEGVTGRYWLAGGKENAEGGNFHFYENIPLPFYNDNAPALLFSVRTVREAGNKQ